MKKIPMSDEAQREFVRITKNINLFASTFNMGVMEQILSFVELYEFKAGEKVFRQGDAGNAFYAVSSGTLRVSTREAFFFSKKIAALGKGDFFGEMAIMYRAPRNATVTCETACQLFTLLAENFQSVLRTNPDCAAEIKKLASDRLFALKSDS
jgi:CRP-like cAMP-binding protein